VPATAQIESRFIVSMATPEMVSSAKASRKFMARTVMEASLAKKLSAEAGPVQ